MRISEAHTNEERGYMLGEPVEYDAMGDTPGELFRMIQKDGWRCTSSVYRDRDEAAPERIGWYFEKIDRYEDTGEPFKHGMWVTLLERPTETTRQTFPMAI